MNRRDSMRLAMGAGISARVSLVRAQDPAAGPRRVGVFAPSTRAKEDLILKPFYEELHWLGWTEGRHVAYDAVYADDHHQDLPRLAAQAFGPATPHSMRLLADEVLA